MVDRPKDLVGGEPASPECRFPDFLCVGAQKAGTTWLDKNLRKHPRLWLPPVKEVHYFDDLHLPATRRWTADHRRRRGSAVMQQYLRKTAAAEWDYRYIGRVADFVTGPLSDNWYGRLFGLARREQICGDITPDYATLPAEGVEHVIALNPNVKIIFLMRDPIERAWSHLRMMVHNRNLTDPSEVERFALEKNVLRGVVARSDYPAILTCWRRFVPEERFHVDFTDNISVHPLIVLQNVCAFLGVDCASDLFRGADRPVHVGEPLEIPAAALTLLKEQLRPVYSAIAALYPQIGAAWQARYY